MGLLVLSGGQGKALRKAGSVRGIFKNTHRYGRGDSTAMEAWGGELSPLGVREIVGNLKYVPSA